MKNKKSLNAKTEHRYRMMLEEKELITKATPIEQRQGANIWQVCSMPERERVGERGTERERGRERGRERQKESERESGGEGERGRRRCHQSQAD